MIAGAVLFSHQVAEQLKLGPSHYAGQAEKMLSVLGRYDDDQLAVIADFLRATATTDWPVRSSGS